MPGRDGAGVGEPQQRVGARPASAGAAFSRVRPVQEDMIVFPDHERCLADMKAFLDRSPEDADPVRRVCDAARLVLRMYAETRRSPSSCYHLTKKVPGLRAYELSVVWRYERALAEYLRGRLGGRQDGILRADVIAAAVVAAPNERPAVLAAFGRPRRRGRRGGPRPGVRAVRLRRRAPAAARQLAEDVVVVAARRGTPLWQVLREVEDAFAHD
ncbi:TetR family transcriptional regulator [Streptomyces violaceorubidus]